jgi:maleate isomerase
MMTDTLGYRLKLGVVTPSVNTVVQPEYDDMRPAGVTNHLARIHIPDSPAAADDDIDRIVKDVDRGLDDAVERVLTCEPAAVVLGVSLEAVYGGSGAGDAIHARLQARFGSDLRLVHAGAAIPAALRALGISDGPIALLTPYGPNAEPHLNAFIQSCGYALHAIEHVRAAALSVMAHTPPEELRAGVDRLAKTGPRAIVQFGADLPMGRVAAKAEAELGLPVVAVNTATYWHALRSNGIDDQVDGFGQLLSSY